MGILVEECAERIYWMELLPQSGLVKQHRIENLISEAEEILATAVASINTAKSLKK